MSPARDSTRNTSATLADAVQAAYDSVHENPRLSLIVAAGGLVLAAPAPNRKRVREIDWAKAALARNPAYEIVATDESAGRVHGARHRHRHRSQTLRLEDLIAGADSLRRLVAQPATAPPSRSPSRSKRRPRAESDARSAQAKLPRRCQVGARRPARSLAEGPGYSITRGDDATPAAATLEGPVRITREAARADARTPGVANVERRTDPIVCQGDRLMRIDGETIEFTGDAVIAEKGCDLYISNARIRAGGVGIIARQARVHIVNSTIGGTRGSYEASEGAEIYVARSTFTGIGRRFDSATMNDLGGNAYQTN